MIYLIDPWASSSVDYDKLVNQFGIQKFSDLIDDVENPHRLMKRGVIFGHRDFDKVNNLINKRGLCSCWWNDAKWPNAYWS